MTGEVTFVCRYTAHLDEIPHDPHPIPVHPAIVSESTAEPVEKLLALYDSTEHRTGKEVVHGLEMAVIKFTNSFAPRPWFERIVDLATALEAALSGTDKSDVTLRICTRAAIILSSDTDPAPAIFADIKALYDLRSSLVHGAIITQKQLEKCLVAVSTVPAAGDCTPRTRNEQLIDRPRDLVRRSILMRLLLNSDGRWPLCADPPPVDQLWTAPAVAEQCALPGTRARQTSALPTLPGPHHRYATASLMTTPAKPTDERHSARARTGTVRGGQPRMDPE